MKVDIDKAELVRHGLHLFFELKLNMTFLPLNVLKLEIDRLMFRGLFFHK